MLRRFQRGQTPHESPSVSATTAWRPKLAGFSPNRKEMEGYDELHTPPSRRQLAGKALTTRSSHSRSSGNTTSNYHSRKSSRSDERSRQKLELSGRAQTGKPFGRKL